MERALGDLEIRDVERLRGNHGPLLPKGLQGAMASVKVLEEGGRLGMLMDQKQNRGVAGTLQRVDAMVSEVIKLRDSGARPGARRNLTTLINRSTARMQLQVSRLQPNSRGEIQVRLESASFDDVLSWLHEMEFREGLLVREVSVTPAGAVGRVNVTVRIAQAS